MPGRTSESELSKSSLHWGKAGDLLLLTTVGAVDGTIVMLAASGRLGSWGAALVVGLTVIAGAGAWLAARQAFAGGPRGWAGYATLVAMALASALAAVTAAWLGQTVGTAVQLHVLPKAGGVLLCLIGAQVAGFRVPRAGPVPATAAFFAAAIAMEGVVQWSPW